MALHALPSVVLACALAILLNCEAVHGGAQLCRYAVDDVLHESVLPNCWPVVTPSYACDSAGGACQDVGTPVRYGRYVVYHCPWESNPLPLGCDSLADEPRRRPAYSGALAMGPMAERPPGKRQSVDR